MVRQIRSIVGAGAFLLAAPAFAQTFSDETFDPEAWTLTVLEVGSGGSAAASQEASGGNPGAYRSYANTVNPPSFSPGPGQPSIIHAYHMQVGATWTPAIDGPITCLSFSNDILAEQEIGHSFAILQDGVLYFASTSYLTHGGGWTTHDASGLTCADFTASFSPELHPDFTMCGAPLTFGFFRASSQSVPEGYTVAGGTDNWSVTVHVLVGCPPSCPGDVDHSGEVDVADLVNVILSWGPYPECPGCTGNGADTNSDLMVDVADLVNVLLLWGPCS